MNKKTVTIIAVIVIAAVAVAAGYAVYNNGRERTTSAPTDTSVTQITEATSVTTSAATETTAESTTQTTTSTTVKAADTSFLKKGYYYLYDKDAYTCCVFKFNGKSGVDIVMFDRVNIVDEDPQYFKGSAQYTVKGDTVVINKLPEIVGDSSITLKVKDNKLYSGKTALEKHDDIKISYAVKHFGA